MNIQAAWEKHMGNKNFQFLHFPKTKGKKKNQSGTLQVMKNSS